MTKYVLSPAYVAVQFWNEDRSDLVEIRRAGGQKVAEIPGDIPKAELDRLLKLDAVVNASEVKDEEPDSPVGEPISGGAPEEPAGNASREAWFYYADALGLAVDPNAGREDIKQAIADSRS